MTVIGEQAIQGFEPNRVTELLQRSTKILPRDPSETLSAIGRALEAVERAVRQMPDDKLGWNVPKRKRPMREFTVHIFEHARHMMEGFGAAPLKSSIAASSEVSFQDIADYGRAILEHYRAWAPKQNLDTLRAPQLAGSKTKSAAERLDLVAGILVQHLRQLYSILEGFGIEPENRVPDREWPSEYVLTTLW